MSTATQRTDEPGVTFTERFVQVGGARLRYREAGQGSPVVVLHDGESSTASPLAALLAQHFRVLAFDIPGSDHGAPRDVAQALTQATTSIGVDHYVLVSTSTPTSLALWQAINAQEHLEALILLSPPALFSQGRTTPSGVTHDAELESRLVDIHTPTLLLLGTNNTSLLPDTGQRYVERLPNCYYVLVYDAGPTIETDRPDALIATVRDFVERRGAFILQQASTALNP